MRDGIDPQSRRVTAGDSAVEQIGFRRYFCKEGIECFIEQFEPRKFRITEVDNNAGTIGGLDASPLSMASAGFHPLTRRICAFCPTCPFSVGGSLLDDIPAASGAKAKRAN